MADPAPEEKSFASSLPFDVSRAFTFFFEDPAWIPKLAVGSLFTFLGPFVVGWVFVVGYAVGIARRTHEAQSPLLPDWEDFQEIFLDGLRGLGVLLAHQLPLVLLSVLMLLALIGGIFLGRSEGANPEKFMFLGLPALVGGFLVVVLLTLASLVYVPAALVRFIQTDRVASAFDVTANIDFIRSHLPLFLTGLVAIVLAAFIAQFGLLIFCVGWFPATFWSACVMGYVVGELAKLADGARSREQGA